MPQHRARLVHQDYWRALGTWSPDTWTLPFLVEHEGVVVGMQALEGSGFTVGRTVDSVSWLVPEVRGRGLGVAMRAAVLSLAFDHLGALAAVSSAWLDNAASLGVSRRLGYVDNGVTLNPSTSGLRELQHLRLTAGDWQESGRGRQVRVVGLEPCLPWFGLAPDPAHGGGNGPGSRHLGMVVDRPAAEVYDFAADPRNLSRWAAGLAGSTVEREGDTWFTDSPMGRVTVAFARPTTSGCWTTKSRWRPGRRSTTRCGSWVTATAARWSSPSGDRQGRPTTSSSATRPRWSRTWPG